jgi:hypothetical protein
MIRPYRHDIILLFSTRIIRLFCYGFLSVILALYLSETGLAEGQIGLLFTFTLLGDAAISLWLTTSGRFIDGRCRSGLYFDPQHPSIDCGSHHRRHQPERE